MDSPGNGTASAESSLGREPVILEADQPPVLSPSSSDKAQYDHEYHSSDERDQDGCQVDASHRVTDMEEIGSKEASQQSANHTNNDVTNTPETTTFHDQPSQPASEQTNNDPGKYSHIELHFYVDCFSVKVMQWIYIYHMVETKP